LFFLWESVTSAHQCISHSIDSIHGRPGRQSQPIIAHTLGGSLFANIISAVYIVVMQFLGLAQERINNKKILIVSFVTRPALLQL
ncbi:hypothetical protein ACJX0J_008149, partial [Zea mays]